MSMGVRHFWQYSPFAFLSFAMIPVKSGFHASRQAEGG
jgi:hypothetical protein